MPSLCCSHIAWSTDRIHMHYSATNLLKKLYYNKPYDLITYDFTLPLRYYYGTLFTVITYHINNGVALSSALNWSESLRTRRCRIAWFSIENNIYSCAMCNRLAFLLTSHSVYVCVFGVCVCVWCVCVCVWCVCVCVVGVCVCLRSEERRVGKVWRSRWSPSH